MNKLTLTLTLLTLPAYAFVTSTSTSYTLEERINKTLFRQKTTIFNGERTANYFINNNATDAETYEEALLNAEKAESMRKRRQAQEERTRAYELKYRGQIRLQQTTLKKATEKLVALLQRALDINLEQFRAYSPETIRSQDDLIEIAERVLPQAQQLYQTPPNGTNIPALSSMLEKIEKLTTLLRAFVNDSVNKGINNAHDTKVLKELIELASTN